MRVLKIESDSDSDTVPVPAHKRTMIDMTTLCMKKKEEEEEVPAVIDLTTGEVLPTKRIKHHLSAEMREILEQLSHVAEPEAAREALCKALQEDSLKMEDPDEKPSIPEGEFDSDEDEEEYCEKQARLDEEGAAITYWNTMVCTDRAETKK